MNTLNGTSYIVLIDTDTSISAERGVHEKYRPVLCGTTNGFNMAFESISLRNKCDKGWDRTESGYGSWGIDLDGFAIGIKNSESTIKSNFQEVALLAVKKKKFWAKMADIDNKVVREGLVRIGSYRETANLEEPYGFSVSFIGLGEPILETELFTAVLSVDLAGLELIQDGNNNLIENRDGY